MKIIFFNYLIIIFYLISSSVSYSIERPEIKNLIVHKDKKKIKNIEFIKSEGQKVSLNNYKSNPLIINFWATWCSPCLKEMPDMQELQKELGSKILVLAVGMGEEAERIEKFQKKHQFEFQILPDPEMTVTQLYGVRNIPITYLINTSGIVVGRALGPREWTRPKLLEFFENLASEQPNP